MNNKPEIKPKGIEPLKHICMTIGELPSSYLETMTYYEMLLWFTKFLKERMIPALDNNALAVEELQRLFIELQSYVNNYFDNLDVQDEINNKLDQMLEDGVLEQIIEQFLQLTSLICFDNVADMKLSPNLTNGSYAKTLGYHSINDGGKALYKIRLITNEDVVDEGSIISLADNTLIAELVINNKINVKQFGAYGDNTHDDTTTIENTIDFAYDNNISIELSPGTYLISHKINFKTSFFGIGKNLSSVIIKANNEFTDSYMVEFYNFDYYKEINNITFNANNKTGIFGSSSEGSGSSISKIINVRFINSDKSHYAINFTSMIPVGGSLTGTIFEQCVFDGNYYNLNINNNMDEVQFNGCRFGVLNYAETHTKHCYNINGNVVFNSCYFALQLNPYNYYNVKAFMNIGTKVVTFNSCFFESYGNTTINYLFLVDNGGLCNLNINNCYLNPNNQLELEALIYAAVNPTIKYTFNLNNLKITNGKDIEFSIPVIKYNNLNNSINVEQNNINCNNMVAFTFPICTGTNPGGIIGHIKGDLHNEQYDTDFYFNYYQYKKENITYLSILEESNNPVTFKLPKANTKYLIDVSVLYNGDINHCANMAYIAHYVHSGLSKSQINPLGTFFTMSPTSSFAITNLSASISDDTITLTPTGNNVRFMYKIKITQLLRTYNDYNVVIS